MIIKEIHFSLLYFKPYWGLMIKIIFSVLGLLGIGAIYHNSLSRRLENLDADVANMRAELDSEIGANVDWLCELQEASNENSVATAKVIGEIDTEVKLLQLDFYKHMEQYKHFDDKEKLPVKARPYIEQEPNTDAIELNLRKHLNFTTRRPVGLD